MSYGKESFNIQTGGAKKLNLLKELEATLKKEKRFVSENGKLLKNSIIQAGLRPDPLLLKLLMGNKITKQVFFEKIGSALVFDKIAFQKFVSNKQFLADSYTSFKNKVGLSDGYDGYLKESNDVVLNWAYKDCVLEGGMTKEETKRDEIFYNTILAPDEITRLYAPKVFTGFERWDAVAVKKDKAKKVTEIKDTDNLLIKGNNLLALHCLKKRYAGKVNLIYIDPPFNTGNDSFKYNDRFSRSTWLTFMKNRLEIAKHLLSDDGNLLIHIDINQSHYLKVLCDEIFRGENFVEEIIWSYGSPSGGRAAGAKPVGIHNYLIHYVKSYSKRKQNKVYTPYTDKYIKDWFKYKDKKGRVYQKRQRGKNEKGEIIWSIQYLDESKGMPLTTVWSDIKQVYADPRAYKKNQAQHSELIKEFSDQKPEKLIQRILDMTTFKGDLVLDFFAGSGTTLSVAHKMGRRWIGVEQMGYIKDLPESRLKNVVKGDQTGITKEVKWKGGGEFIYCELKEWNEKYIQEVRKAKTKAGIKKVYQLIKKEAFYRYDVNMSAYNGKDFDVLSLREQKDALCDCLDINHLYVNYSERDDARYKVTKEEKELTKQIYEEKNEIGRRYSVSS